MKGHEGPLVYLFSYPGGAVSCAAAGYDVLEAFGDLASFDEYFGGHSTFGWPPSQSRYLGVWGQRNCGRFRRILRARHGELTIVHRPPPARLVVVATRSTRPDRAGRLKIEARL